MMRNCILPLFLLLASGVSAQQVQVTSPGLDVCNEEPLVER